MLKNKVIFLIGVLVFAGFVIACCPETSCPGDYDCDKVLDEKDNCKFVWNPLQEDCDDDDRGNVCDPSPNCEEDPSCGNDVLEYGEECDDGNTIDGDGCSSICTIEEEPEPECGNGELEQGEECDDGNTIDGDGCSSDCLIEEENEEEEEDCKKCRSGGSNHELVFFCEPNWRCSGWSDCDSGTMQRKCYDSNNCGVSYNKPIEKTGCDLMSNVLIAPEQEGLSLITLFLISLLVIIILLLLVNTL